MLNKKQKLKQRRSDRSSYRTRKCNTGKRNIVYIKFSCRHTTLSLNTYDGNTIVQMNSLHMGERCYNAAQGKDMACKFSNELDKRSIDRSRLLFHFGGNSHRGDKMKSIMEEIRNVGQ